MMPRLRITRRMFDFIRTDLRRPHAFALERVGFVTCRFGYVGRDLLILAAEYHPVRDENYIMDRRFGALIDGAAFRAAMQLALTGCVGLFHVHLHDHLGVPGPSKIDRTESARFVPDFFHVRPELPHGTFILSADRMSGLLWLRRTLRPRPISQVAIVGAPTLMVNLRGGQL